MPVACGILTGPMDTCFNVKLQFKCKVVLTGLKFAILGARSPFSHPPSSNFQKGFHAFIYPVDPYIAVKFHLCSANDVAMLLTTKWGPVPALTLSFPTLCPPHP
jgi:hypothetical protein